MILTPRTRMNGKSRKINSTFSNPIGTSSEQSSSCCWKESADDAFLTEVFLNRYGLKSTEQVLNVEPDFTRTKQMKKVSGDPAEIPLPNGISAKSRHSKNNGIKERFRTRSQQMVREAWVSAENKHSVNNSNAYSLVQCQQSSACTAKQPDTFHKGFTNLKVSHNKQENNNRNQVSNYKLYRDLSRSIKIPHDSAATRRIGFVGVSRRHIMDDINTNRGRADHEQLMSNLRQSTDMYRPYTDTAVPRLCSHHLVSDKYQPILSHQSRLFSGENCWRKRTSSWRNTVPFSSYRRLETFDTASHFPYSRSKSCDFPRRSGLLLYPAVNKFTPASRRPRPGVYRNSRRITKILNDIDFEGRKHGLYNEKTLGSFNDQTPKTDNSRSSYPPYYDRKSSSVSVEPFTNFKDKDKIGTDENKIKDSSVDLTEFSYFKFNNFLSPHSSKLAETPRPSHERSFRHSSSLFPPRSVNVSFKQSKDAERRGTNDMEIKESSVDTRDFKYFTTPISFFYNSPKSSETSEKELSINPGNGLTQERRSERSQSSDIRAGDVDSICFKPCGRGTLDVALKPSSPTKDGFKLTGPKRLLATPNTAATVNCICSAADSPSPCRRHQTTCNRRPSSSVGLCQGAFYTGKDTTRYGPRSPTSPQSRHTHFTIPLYDLRSTEADQARNLKKPEGSFTLGSPFGNLTKASDMLKRYFTLRKSDESDRSEEQDRPSTERGELQVPQSILSSAVPEGIPSYSNESWVRTSVPMVSVGTENLFSPPKSSREAREAKNWEQRGLSAEQHHVNTLFTRSFAKSLSPDDALRAKVKLAVKERKEVQKESQERDAVYFEGNGYMIHSWAENTGNPTRYNVTSVTSPSIECSRSEALIASCKKIICQKRHSCLGESRQTAGKADVGKNRLKKKNLEIKGKHNKIASLDQTIMKGNEKKNHIPVVAKERKAEKRKDLESRREQVVEKSCMQESNSLRYSINDEGVMQRYRRQKKSRNSTESKLRVQKEIEKTYDTKLRSTKIAGDGMQETARHSEIAKMVEKKEKLKEELKQKIKDRLREREAATNPDKQAGDRQQISEKMSEDKRYYWERNPKETEKRSELSSMPKQYLQDNAVEHGAPEKILPESSERNKLARDGRKAKTVPMTDLTESTRPTEHAATDHRGNKESTTQADSLLPEDGRKVGTHPVTELTKSTLLTELGVTEHRKNQENTTQIDSSSLFAENGKKSNIVPATEPSKSSPFTEFATTEHRESEDKEDKVPSLQQRTQQTDTSAAFPPTLLWFAAPILQNMKMTLMRQIRNVSDQNRTIAFSPPPRRGLYLPLEAYPSWPTDENFLELPMQLPETTLQTTDLDTNTRLQDAGAQMATTDVLSLSEQKNVKNVHQSPGSSGWNPPGRLREKNSDYLGVKKSVHFQPVKPLSTPQLSSFSPTVYLRDRLSHGVDPEELDNKVFEERQFSGMFNKSRGSPDNSRLELGDRESKRFTRKYNVFSGDDDIDAINTKESDGHLVTVRSKESKQTKESVQDSNTTEIKEGHVSGYSSAANPSSRVASKVLWADFGSSVDPSPQVLTKTPVDHPDDTLSDPEALLKCKSSHLPNTVEQSRAREKSHVQSVSESQRLSMTYESHPSMSPPYPQSRCGSKSTHRRREDGCVREENSSTHQEQNSELFIPIKLFLKRLENELPEDRSRSHNQTSRQIFRNSSSDSSSSPSPLTRPSQTFPFTTPSPVTQRSKNPSSSEVTGNKSQSLVKKKPPPKKRKVIKKERRKKAFDPSRTMSDQSQVVPESPQPPQGTPVMDFEKAVAKELSRGQDLGEGFDASFVKPSDTGKQTGLVPEGLFISSIRTEDTAAKQLQENVETFGTGNPPQLPNEISVPKTKTANEGEKELNKTSQPALRKDSGQKVKASKNRPDKTDNGRKLSAHQEVRANTTDKKNREKIGRGRISGAVKKIDRLAKNLREDRSKMGIMGTTQRKSLQTEAEDQRQLTPKPSVEAAGKTRIEDPANDIFLKIRRQELRHKIIYQCPRSLNIDMRKAFRHSFKRITPYLPLEILNRQRQQNYDYARCLYDGSLIAAFDEEMKILAQREMLRGNKGISFRPFNDGSVSTA